MKKIFDAELIVKLVLVHSLKDNKRFRLKLKNLPLLSRRKTGGMITLVRDLILIIASQLHCKCETVTILVFSLGSVPAVL